MAIFYFVIHLENEDDSISDVNYLFIRPETIRNDGILRTARKHIQIQIQTTRFHFKNAPIAIELDRDY